MFEAPSLELHSRIYSGHSNALAALLRKQQMSSSRLHSSGKHSSSLTLNHPATLQHAVAGISSGKSKSGEIAVESQSPQLTEENLKQHSKLTRNQPMSFVERISIWRRSLPDHFEDEQTLRDSIQRSSSPKNPSTKWKAAASAVLNSRDIHQTPTVGDVKRSLASATAWVPGGNNNNAVSNSKRKHERKALRPLPSLGSLGAEQGKSKQSNTQLAAKGKEESAANVPESGKSGTAAATGSGRGKLLCCLKVEIKTGVFRMLPVHENDDAHELSLEFCKTNHLMNSVEALKNHMSHDHVDFHNHNPTLTEQRILCASCGTVIAPNPANMCINCIRSDVDITEGIPKQATIHYCKGCDRYLQPPNVWVVAELESKELLTLCLKKLRGLSKVRLVDAGFIWTEPHSRRVKVKLTIQKEVFANTILQQVFVVEYMVSTQQCEECTRVAAQLTWKAVVQVRQKVSHKRTFLWLEQVILKHNAHQNTTNIKEAKDGIDFYYTSRSHAIRMVEFLQSVVPAKLKTSEQLISQDIHSGTANYKFSYSLEIVPICKDDLFVLPAKVAKSLSDISPLVICSRVSNSLSVLDPNTLKISDMRNTVYWDNPCIALSGITDLVEFYVIDVQHERVHNGRFGLATAEVSRSKDLSQTYLVRTHLGNILRPGDHVLGYDLRNANFNDENWDKFITKKNAVPDIVLVRKSYPNARKKLKGRSWKLKTITVEEEVEAMGKSKAEKAKADQDYELFLRDIEEDPELRGMMNLYKQPSKHNAHGASTDAMQDGEDSDEEPEEDFPEINEDELLEELMDGMAIGDEADEGANEGDEEVAEEEHMQPKKRPSMKSVVLLLFTAVAAVLSTPLPAQHVARSIERRYSYATSSNAFHYAGPLQHSSAHGACSAPAVRKEWRTLSPDLQRNYLDAVTCLMQTPSLLTNDSSVSRSVFEDFSYIHFTVVGRVHGTAQFLPWHRTLILLFEFALQDFCGYKGTLPYWDWTKDANAMHNSPIFSDTAFGGNGNGSTPSCVQNGRFAASTALMGHNKPQCITRKFDFANGMQGHQFTGDVIKALVQNGGRWEFFYPQVYLGPHSAVHNGIGGDFGNPPAAGNDPLFFIHHAMLDKVWNDWQDENPQFANSYSGNLEADDSNDTDAQVMDFLADLPRDGPTNGRTLIPEIRVQETLWSDGGGWFCYIYE
ncbi:hypothetical protein HDU81_000873 [Chytriomyces hyalinus]|nr:hypothetical protein HDU81_000873 [Chytriomyces hyalinus]